MKKSRTIALIPLKEGGENATHIEVELYYTKGGMNYWTGSVDQRGIYVRVVPITIQVHDTPSGTISYTTKSFTIFSGVKKHLLDMSRWNAKTFESFIPSRELIESMIEHVCAKNDVEVVDNFIFLEEGAES